MNRKMSQILKKFKKEKEFKSKFALSFKERNRLSNGYLMKKTIGSIIFKIIRGIMLFGLCFLILQPILNKISVSLMAEKDLYDATIISVPRNWSSHHYDIANQLMNFKESVLWTIFISFVVAVIQISACTLVGYGFARYKFPFRNVLFGCVMLSIVIPPQTILTALYLNFKYFNPLGLLTLFGGQPVNLLNSIWPYVMICAGCMGLKSGLYIFMIRQYFRGIPKELEEAAYVDGCGKLKTFFIIMVPDAKPILTSCFLFAYVWQWTDTFYSSLFLDKFGLLANSVGGLGDKFQQYIASLSNNTMIPSQGELQAIISTGMLMVIAPLLIIYLVAQKGFVESLAQAGIKM